MEQYKLDDTRTLTTARSGKVGIQKMRNIQADNDPMINEGLDNFVTCQVCGTNKRDYYANIEGVLTCGHCIYLKNKIK